jgi:NAD(P)H-dependent FMN reductase
VTRMAEQDKLVVSVIIGSTRPNRFAAKPAEWILDHLQQRPQVQAQLLDLKDFPLPWFEEESAPKMLGEGNAYENHVVARWTEAIAASDAFVIVTPEYNHGYPGVLKNALDYVYRQWNRKPVGFVSYGVASGVRVVEQLRMVAVELQMTPVNQAVHLPLSALMAHHTGGDTAAELARENRGATWLIDDLAWWGRVLKAARQADALTLV